MNSISKRWPISDRRRRRQSGLEAIEFGLFFVLTLPMFMWMFINGMNFLRLDKANDVTRAAALMYIKGQDFTFVGTQNIISLVANGLNLDVASSTTAGGVTTGNGLLIFSTVQYIGPNTCSNCTNLNQYVFLNQVFVGNTGLQFNGVTVQSSLGRANTAIWSSSTGAVSGSQTDNRARVSSSFANFGTSNGNPIVIGDGQIVYVVESFFNPQGGFGTGAFNGNGVYTRVLM